MAPKNVEQLNLRAKKPSIKSVAINPKKESPITAGPKLKKIGIKRRAPTPLNAVIRLTITFFVFIYTPIKCLYHTSSFLISQLSLILLYNKLYVKFK